jgi:hypothetical protein
MSLAPPATCTVGGVIFCRLVLSEHLCYYVSVNAHSYLPAHLHPKASKPAIRFYFDFEDRIPPHSSSGRIEFLFACPDVLFGEPQVQFHHPLLRR